MLDSFTFTVNLLLDFFLFRLIVDITLFAGFMLHYNIWWTLAFFRLCPETVFPQRTMHCFQALSLTVFILDNVLLESPVLRQYFIVDNALFRPCP